MAITWVADVWTILGFLPGLSCLTGSLGSAGVDWLRGLLTPAKKKKRERHSKSISNRIPNTHHSWEFFIHPSEVLKFLLLKEPDFAHPRSALTWHGNQKLQGRWPVAPWHGVRSILVDLLVFGCPQAIIRYSNAIPTWWPIPRIVSGLQPWLFSWDKWGESTYNWGYKPHTKWDEPPS